MCRSQSTPSTSALRVCVGGGGGGGGGGGWGVCSLGAPPHGPSDTRHDNLLPPPPTPLRYLLNLDGFTASTRFAKLLAMNSLVMKQESGHLEHYYRSVQPCVHYVPIWTHAEDDVFEMFDLAQVGGRVGGGGGGGGATQPPSPSLPPRSLAPIAHPPPPSHPRTP